MARNTQAPSAPPKDAPQPSAPEIVAALGALAESEHVDKAERVYVDVPETRCAMADGRLTVLQRERRADGSSGPILLALVKRNPDGRESAQRFPLADLQRASRAYARRGLVLFDSGAGADASE